MSTDKVQNSAVLKVKTITLVVFFCGQYAWKHRVNLKQACLIFGVLQENSKKIRMHIGIKIRLYTKSTVYCYVH